MGHLPDPAVVTVTQAFSGRHCCPSQFSTIRLVNDTKRTANHPLCMYIICTLSIAHFHSLFMINTLHSASMLLMYYMINWKDNGVCSFIPSIMIHRTQDLDCTCKTFNLPALQSSPSPTGYFHTSVIMSLGSSNLIGSSIISPT